MIGLDTNIIVRYLTQDDKIQSSKATRLIEQRLTPEKPGFVSVVAIVGTVWVLERAYDLTDSEIAAVLESMLTTDAFVLECEEDVFAAMIALKDRRGSFADALIGELGARAGCSRTLTFDVKAARLSHFELL